MGRAIDIDKLCTDLMERWDIADKQKEELVKHVMADIVTPIVVSQPTIEPERKKGRWIAHPDDAFDEWFCCSVCHKGLTMFDGTYNFCPNCGAEMTEGEECQSS